MGKRWLLAVDSNILFDLAKELDFAHTFRHSYQEKGFLLLVPPTVVQELTHKAQQGDELAMTALKKMQEWRLEPFNLISVGHGITERFSQHLQHTGDLPNGELNDGLILAETSLRAIPALVTSDKHLLDIDRERLRIAFTEMDLEPVTVVHPKGMTAALDRRR